MNCLRRLLVATVILAVTGCETTPVVVSGAFQADSVVSLDQASFYIYGPQQAGGPSRKLPINEGVMVLRKGFGYSQVRLSDEEVGYMANEDLQPAPPTPRRRLGRNNNSAASTTRSSRTARSFAPEDDLYEQIADPNLDLLPEDLPLEPLPELVP
jgi:hypothetical protein